MINNFEAAKMKHSLDFFIILPFLILCSSIIIQAQPEYLYHICPNDTVFTRNSIYQANLNLTLSSLSLNSNRSNGFYNTSSGNSPTGDAFGLFLCRGDISAEVCRNCVATAVRDIPQRCPVEVDAIIWYAECFLRYSNQSFFARLQTSMAIYLWNTQNITDISAFNSLLSTSMRDAAARAAIGTPGGKKFAVKEANFTAFQKLYTLVQCTPDLSSSDCSLCLETAISQLPTCCGGKQGGRVLTPSCNIRYEIYPFYNASAIEVPPPPPSPPGILPPPSSSVAGTNGGLSTTIIIAIAVPISLSVWLFCLGCIFLRRRAKKKYNFIPEDGISLKFEFAAMREKKKNAGKGAGLSLPPPQEVPLTESAPEPQRRVSSDAGKRPSVAERQERPKKIWKNVLPNFEGKNESSVRQSLVDKYGPQLSLADPDIQADLTRSLYFQADSNHARSLSNKEIGAMLYHKFYTALPLTLELLRRDESLSSAEHPLKEAAKQKQKLEAELKRKEAAELELTKKVDVLTAQLEAQKVRHEEELRQLLDKKAKLYATLAMEYGDRLLKSCGELFPDVDFSQVEVEFPDEEDLNEELLVTGPSTSINPDPIITDLTVEDNATDLVVADPVGEIVNNVES